MIIAHLIGGNEVKGITKGTVLVNGNPLDATYEELVRVCGNISLGELDTSVSARRSSEEVTRDFIQLVHELDDEIDAENFVHDNHLTAEICYSTYHIDPINQTLTLTIDTYH